MKTKPNFFLLFFLFLSMLFINSGCNLLISIIDDLQGEKSYVSISPENATLMPGNSMQLTGRYYDRENDTEINITNSGEWRSSNTRVLSISYSGYIEALDVGTAEITLAYNDLTAKASLSVSYIQPIGVEIYFEKYNYADATQQENQDRLSNKVWITSGNSEGLYNAYSESSYKYGSSPIDTEWAIGPTMIQSPENYSPWDTALDYENSYYVNKTLSLHCISEDLWFDIILENWTPYEYGGGFAYRRTRVLPPGSITFPGIYFEKNNDADFNLPENQDWIIDSVRITRGNYEGIFNIYSETGYNYNSSPVDTEWSLGPTDTYTFNKYRDWEYTIDYCPSCHLFEPLSMHIVSENLWYNIVFVKWAEDGMGGGFAYYREQVSPPSGYPPLGTFFTKYDNTDTTSPTNQDRITPRVWITRGESDSGIFNAYNGYETNYSPPSSPLDTEWAMGPTSGHLYSDYKSWEEAVYPDPRYYLGETISLHLIQDNLWFDVVFLSWSEVGKGGFSYYREQVDPPTGGELIYK